MEITDFKGWIRFCSFLFFYNLTSSTFENKLGPFWASGILSFFCHSEFISEFVF